MNVVKASANDGTQLVIFVNSGQFISHHFGGCSKITACQIYNFLPNKCLEDTMTLKYICYY